MKHLIVILLAGACTAAALAQAEAPADAPPGPYDRLDADVLLERLAELRMSALLEAMAEELPLADERLEAYRCLAEAQSATTQAQRDERLERAVQHWRTLLARASPGDDPEARLARARDLYRLGEWRGLVQAGPYARRLLALQGSGHDAARVQLYSAEALEALAAAEAELSALLEQSRTDWDRIASGLVRRADQRLREVRYQRAWVGLYCATALAGEAQAAGERDDLLRAVRTTAMELAAMEATESAPAPAPALTGARGWSLLLAGLASRQMGDAEGANDLLGACSGSAEPAIRRQAQFERARLAMDIGDWPLAARWAEDFARMTAEVPEGPERVALELQGAFLAQALHRGQAEALAGAEPHTAQAQALLARQPMLEFLERRPAHARTLCGLLARQEQAIPEADLDALGLFARATEQLAGPAPQAGEVERLLRAALACEGPLASRVHPWALWSLAVGLYADPARRVESAERFAELARRFGGHQRAALAAENAVRILDAHLAGLERSGRAVPDEPRRALLEAGRLLLERWGPDRPELRERWARRLAEQSAELGQTDEALAWLARLPAGGAQALAGRFDALALRHRLLTAQAEDDPTRLEQARALLGDLEAFVGDAQAYGGPESARLGAGAELLAARLMRDALAQPESALAQLVSARDRWPDARPMIEAMRIETLVGLGRLTEAVEALRSTPDLSAEQVHPLAAGAARALRGRIEQHRYSPDRAAELARWRSEFWAAAQMAMETLPPAAPADRAYAVRQLAAQARLEAGQAEAALAELAELAVERPADAANLLGQARALVALGRPTEAFALYDRLLAGLDGQAHRDLYWRCQLELAQAALAAAQTPADRARLAVRLRQLRARDATFGGLEEPFTALEAQLRP